MNTSQHAALVLDTSVFSLLYNEKRALIREPYSRIIEAAPESYLPFQALGEAVFGALSAGWGNARIRWIHTVASQFDLVHTSDDIVQSYAELRAATRKIGRELVTSDAWIAAVAVSLGVPLLHHDADFEGLGFPGLETVTLLGGV